MRIPVDHQRRIYRKYAKQAVINLAEAVVQNADDLVELAERRAFNEGVTQYGDASFHLPLPQLHLEVLDELADGVFYEAIAIARTEGDIV